MYLTYLYSHSSAPHTPRNDQNKVACILQGDKTERRQRTEYHPSVTPSGFDFVGNRYRGFRFAPSPSVICRPVGTKRKPERLADHRQGCSAAEPLLRYHTY